MVRRGKGVRTRQFNPGAENLAQYTMAVTEHRRGRHDAGGRVIHETPKEKRREFAREIWSRRRVAWHRSPRGGAVLNLSANARLWFVTLRYMFGFSSASIGDRRRAFKRILALQKVRLR